MDMKKFTDMTPHQVFEHLITDAGGQAAFGQVIGKSQQLVSHHAKKRRGVPKQWLVDVHEKTGVPLEVLKNGGPSSQATSSPRTDSAA